MIRSATETNPQDHRECFQFLLQQIKKINWNQFYWFYNRMVSKCHAWRNYELNIHAGIGREKKNSSRSNEHAVLHENINQLVHTPTLGCVCWRLRSEKRKKERKKIPLLLFFGLLLMRNSRDIISKCHWLKMLSDIDLNHEYD